MFYKIMCLVNTLEKASTGRTPDIFTRLSHAPGESRLPVRLIMSSSTPLSELCLGDASASASPPPPRACLRGKLTPFPLETPSKSVSPGEASPPSVGAGSPVDFGDFGQGSEAEEHPFSTDAKHIFSFLTGACNVGVDEPRHVLQLVTAVFVATKSPSEFPHFFQALESIVEVTQLFALV